MWCPRLLELPLRTGSMRCLWTLSPGIGAPGTPKRVGGHAGQKDMDKEQMWGQACFWWGPLGTAHPEDTPGGLGGHPQCPLRSLGHGLWMVLSKGAARLHGHRAMKHLVWDMVGYTLGHGCPEREAMAGRGTDGVCRMWRSWAGTCPECSLQRRDESKLASICNQLQELSLMSRSGSHLPPVPSVRGIPPLRNVPKLKYFLGP